MMLKHYLKQISQMCFVLSKFDTLSFYQANKQLIQKKKQKTKKHLWEIQPECA